MNPYYDRLRWRLYQLWLKITNKTILLPKDEGRTWPVGTKSDDKGKV